MGQVGEIATHLDAQAEAFRSRPLGSGHYTFLWMGGLTIKVRDTGRPERPRSRRR
nr:transposase [Micromonospora sp. RTP1Z1]